MSKKATSPPNSGQPFDFPEDFQRQHRQSEQIPSDESEHVSETMSSTDEINDITQQHTEQTEQDTQQETPQQNTEDGNIHTDETPNRTDGATANNAATDNRTDNSQTQGGQTNNRTDTPRTQFTFNTQPRTQQRTNPLEPNIQIETGEDIARRFREQEIQNVQNYLQDLIAQQTRSDPSRTVYRPSPQAHFFRAPEQAPGYRRQRHHNSQPPPTSSPIQEPRGRSPQRRQQRRFIPTDIETSSLGSQDDNDARSQHNRTRQESLGSLIDGLKRFKMDVTDPPPAPINKPTLPPLYVPVEQQALQMHQRSIDDTLERADMMQKMMALMLQSRTNSSDDITPEFHDMARQMAQEIQTTKVKAAQSAQGMKKASKIVEYYKTPIQKPQNLESVESSRTRVNLKEVIMVTGYFDPNDKESDFKHVWHKLLDYGQSQNYGETHYMQALGAVLKKEAYETFCDFRQTDRSLEEILEYFATVYTKKRTIGDAKSAVDNFTRKKGETIIACMDRTLLVVDRLKIHYEPNAWIHIRQQMRRHILMQVIKEETKRHIQMEEDYITETTGMPYDFDNLIRKADNYERYNNAVPDRDIQTVFKVASGGYLNKQTQKSPEQQLQQMKKDQMLETRLSTLQARLENIEANAVAPRPVKFSDKADLARQHRSRERDNIQRSNRDASLNRNRNFNEQRNLLEDDDVQMKEAKPIKPDPPPAQKFVPPNPYQDQSQKQGQNFQPSNRPSQGQQNWSTRPQQSNQGFSQNNRPQQGQRSRPTTFQEQRQRQASRSPGGTFYRPTSQSPFRSQTPFDNRTRSPSANSGNNSRNPSYGRSQNNDPTTITTKGKVYISINGQEYVARPNFKPGN